MPDLHVDDVRLSYPDAGHSPHITHPAEHVAAVTAFAAAALVA